MKFVDINHFYPKTPFQRLIQNLLLQSQKPPKSQNLLSAVSRWNPALPVEVRDLFIHPQGIAAAHLSGASREMSQLTPHKLGETVNICNAEVIICLKFDRLCSRLHLFTTHGFKHSGPKLISLLPPSTTTLPMGMRQRH